MPYHRAEYTKEDPAEIEKILIIQKVTAEFFGLTIEELCQKCRQIIFVGPRQISIYISKQLTKASLDTIGKYHGNKDHATVKHSVTTVENLKCEKGFTGKMDEIMARSKYQIECAKRPDRQFEISGEVHSKTINAPDLLMAIKEFWKRHPGELIANVCDMDLICLNTITQDEVNIAVNVE